MHIALKIELSRELTFEWFGEATRLSRQESKFCLLNSEISNFIHDQGIEIIFLIK